MPTSDQSRRRTLQQPAVVARCLSTIDRRLCASLTRLIPASLYSELVRPNPDWSFNIVYVLGAESSLYYSTDWNRRKEPANASAARPRQVHEPTAYANLNKPELKRELESVASRMSVGKRTRIHVHFQRSRTAAEWRTALQLPSYARLDRFVAHENIAERILNMRASPTRGGLPRVTQPYAPGRIERDTAMPT
jgi:hypothetical protein